MKVKVHFRQVNEEFSQCYADFHDLGKESLQNPKHKWEIVYSSKDIESAQFIPMQDYVFIGVDPDGNEAPIRLKDMCLLNCFKEENQALITYGISRSSLSVFPEERPRENYRNTKYGTFTQYFDIRAEAEFVELAPGLFVELNELPVEIKR